MGDEYVDDENQETGHHDALGAGLAQFESPAFDAIAVKGGDGGHDEGEHESLGDSVDDVIYAEAVGESVHEVVGTDTSGKYDGDVPAHEGKADAVDDEHGVHDEGGDNLGQNKVRGRVDAHHLKGVDLLGDAHTADFGRDAGSEVAHQQQADDSGAQLHDNGGSRHETHCPGGNPAALDLHGSLDGDDAAHGNGDNGHDEQ